MPETCVAALYRFTPFADPAALCGPLRATCVAAGVRGTLLLAAEGINGTIAGPDAGVARVLAHIRALPGCAALRVRLSHSAGAPFHRLKVRAKRAIVTLGVPVDPGGAGTYVAPADWNALIADPGTVLIDTRNAYEVAVGSFAGAIDPGTAAFADFPAWFRANRERLFAGRAAPKVAMFCTGGIRCEKATAFLKAEGVADVRHLEGGILAYLDTVPPADSRWQGECFVFDERVSVGPGLTPGSHRLCRACRMPVGAAAAASPDYTEGISCPACADARSAEQRAGYAERHRQARLAETRGSVHAGASPHCPPDPTSGPEIAAITEDTH